jgi:hypothetical protein
VQSCLAPKELFPEEEEREIFIFHDDNDK